jgi:hypothetical protein
MSPIVLWILGLNHSGTTILWKSFRKDNRLTCFDEPFTAHIGATFPKNNVKSTFDEYLNIFGSTPSFFWDIYEPIYPLQELDPFFTERQKNYIRSLLNSSDKVVIDETHLHFHLYELSHLTPNAYIIHLYRRASSFVTSHLCPSSTHHSTLFRNIFRLFKDYYNRKFFWKRMRCASGMARDDVIGADSNSKFGIMLSQKNYNVDKIMKGPAHLRLLAYWHYQFKHIENIGPKLFNNNFLSLRYEDFASDPYHTMNFLYNWIELSAPENPSYSDVYSPKAPFSDNDIRWIKSSEIAGFSSDDMKDFL